MGQVNMRDTRVEEVEHISDSDSDEVSQNVEKAMPEPTIGIFPNHVHQGPTYLIFPNRAEQEKWLYQLTVVSGGYIHLGSGREGGRGAMGSDVTLHLIGVFVIV